MRLLPATWTLRAGPAVRRESIPLSRLENLGAVRLGLSYLMPEEARSCIVRVSDDTAFRHWLASP